MRELAFAIAQQQSSLGSIVSKGGAYKKEKVKNDGYRCFIAYVTSHSLWMAVCCNRNRKSKPMLYFYKFKIFLSGNMTHYLAICTNEGQR